MKSFPEHLNDDDLLAYVEGKLPAAEAQQLREWLRDQPDLSDQIVGMMLDRQLIKALPKITAPPEFGEMVAQRIERDTLLTGVETELRDVRRHWWRSRALVAASLVLMFALFALVVASGLITHDNLWTRWAEGGSTHGGTHVQVAALPKPSVVEKALQQTEAATTEVAAAPAPTMAMAAMGQVENSATSPAVAAGAPGAFTSAAQMAQLSRVGAERDRSSALADSVITVRAHSLRQFAAWDRALRDHGATTLDDAEVSPTNTLADGSRDAATRELKDRAATRRDDQNAPNAPAENKIAQASPEPALLQQSQTNDQTAATQSADASKRASATASKDKAARDGLMAYRVTMAPSAVNALFADALSADALSADALSADALPYVAKTMLDKKADIDAGQSLNAPAAPVTEPASQPAAPTTAPTDDTPRPYRIVILPPN
jgi:hypothetical protein